MQSSPSPVECTYVVADAEQSKGRGMYMGSASVGTHLVRIWYGGWICLARVCAGPDLYRSRLRMSAISLFWQSLSWGWCLIKETLLALLCVEEAEKQGNDGS